MSQINFKAVLETAGFQSGLNKMQSSLAKIRGPLLAVSATAAAVSGAFVLMARHGLSSVDALAKLARGLGSTVRGVQALQRAADLSGVSLEKMNQTSARLQQTLGSIMDGGGGKAADALDRLGLSARELAVMDADRRMESIADAIRGLGLTSAETSDLLGDLGIRGSEMVGFFIEGGDAIRTARDEMEQYGLAISDIDARNVERVNDAMSVAKTVVSGLGQQIAAGLAPMLTAIVEMFNDKIPGGADRMRDIVSRALDGIVGAVGYIIDALEMMGVIMNGMRGIGEMVAGAIISAFGRIENVVIGITNAIIDMINKVAEAVNTFVDSAAAVPGLGFVSGARVGTISNVTGSGASETGSGLISSGAGRIMDSARDSVRIMTGGGRGSTMVETIRQNTEIIQEESARAVEAANEARDALREVNETGLELGDEDPAVGTRGAASAAARAIEEEMPNAANIAKQATMEWLESMKVGLQDVQNVMKNTYMNFENTIVDFVRTGKLNFRSMIDSMIADLIRLSLRSMLFGGPNGGGGLLSGFLGSLFSRNGNVFGASGQLNFAHGGVFNQKFAMPMGDGRLAIGAEAGPEAIMPLQRDRNGRLGVIVSGRESAPSGPSIVNTFNTTINPGENTDPQSARRFADEFNRAIEVRIMQTMAKAQNTGVGGRR